MATIQDVAAAANVSTATVSRVLNGKSNVHPTLAARVRAAADQLDYRPNVLAKGLRTHTTTVLGVVVPDIENPFFTAVVRGVEDAAQAKGYSVLLCNSDEDLEKEARYLDVLVDQRAAGVILAPASEQRSSVDALTEQSVPVVAVDRALPEGRIDTVTVNNSLGAQQATTALADAGHRRIAMVSGLERTTTAVQRLAGYRQALSDRDLPYDEHLVVSGQYRLEGGYQATMELMRQSPRPEALFVANNLMAMGALQALGDLGMRIPDDVSLASFDELPWSREVPPALAVVSQPAYDMGRLAADILMSRITGDTGARRHVVLEPTLRRGGNEAWMTDAIRRWAVPAGGWPPR